MPLQERFERFVRTRDLIHEGDRVLVAVSGGVDSVVLLHLVHALTEKLGIVETAAHFDHAMRPDSADDAEWVKALCSAWSIPLIERRTARALSGETQARAERYRFLQHAMRESGATRVATAHHADDQVETILMRLLRGTGLRGLSGIPVRRGPFIRPLLRFYKDELVAYAEAHGLQHREDPTNADLRFTRNRIRASVVPALLAAQPNARAKLLTLARHAARTETAWRSVISRLERELITSSGDGCIELARPILLEYHPALRARAVRHVFRRFAVVPGRASTRHILQFCQNAESGAALEVAGVVRVERAFDRFILERIRFHAEESAVVVTGDRGSGCVIAGGRSYDVAWLLKDECSAASECFDPMAINEGLVVRAWRPGDRIRLAYGSKKLKKLFSERRIPVSERARIPVVADQTGHVLWVVGVARSVHAMPLGPGPILNVTVKHAELG